MRTSHSLSLLVSLLTLSAVLAPVAPAQNAQEIIQTAIDRYEQRMSGVENYTIVQDVMGFESTSYYEKHTVDGRSVFKLVDTYGDDSQDESSDGPMKIDLDKFKREDIYKILRERSKNPTGKI